MMTTHNDDRSHREFDRPSLAEDTGGLHAPPELHGMGKVWWWFYSIVLVTLARLRFIGILIVIGIVIMKWDTLTAHYEKWTRPTTAEAVVEPDVEYFCPMHPSIIRDHPDKCPICFMPLSKRKKGGPAEPLPPGTVSRVQLSPYRIVLAGIQTWPVDYLRLTKDITAVGFVEFNERGQRTVSARVAGRIDKLFVNETGQMVEAGDELASLYSPDLLVTVQNLLDAKRSGNAGLLENARSRLELLGIDKGQIDDLLESGKANTHLKIRSPIGGHVINKYVREGQYVQEGTPLYDVADLSTVWIQAQIYEDDMPFLPVAKDGGSIESDGLEVVATTRAFPNEQFHGKLTFIYPHVDEETRTVTVRFELDNPGHKLRPGSTATVTLKVKPEDLPMFKGKDASEAQKALMQDGRVLAVPEGSIIDTGKQKIAYREAAPGVYEGVELKIGPRMLSKDGGIYYPVLAGIKAGERVVTSGSFLVDAETRLNPALGSVYFGGSGGSSAKGTKPNAARPSAPENPEAKVEAALAQLSPEDRKLAEAQRICPILKNRLGSMGKPEKVVVDGQPVFLCCSGCNEKALADPKATLATVAGLKGSARPAEGKNEKPDTKDGKQYSVVGKVTAVGDDKLTVTIDHEAIEGLMPAMEMRYSVDKPQLLEGVKSGDAIQGKLEVRGAEYVITELHKR